MNGSINYLTRPATNSTSNTRDANAVFVPA